MTRKPRLVALAVAIVVVWGRGSAQEVSPLRQLNDSLVDLSRKLTPAVVLVLSDGFQLVASAAATLPVQVLQRVSGSGVILSEDGYIVTNTSSRDPRKSRCSFRRVTPNQAEALYSEPV